MNIAGAPAPALRALVRVAGRHLARRASRHLSAIDERDLETLAREAQALAHMMQALRARARQCWQQVSTASLTARGQ